MISTVQSQSFAAKYPAAAVTAIAEQFIFESVSNFVQHDLPDGRIVLPLQAAVNVWAGKSYMTILQTVTGFLPGA